MYKSKEYRFIIESMSLSKKDSEKMILNLQDSIVTHILYILVFGNTTYTKHWLNELSNFLYIVSRRTVTKSGRIKLDRLYDLLVPGTFQKNWGVLTEIQEVKNQKSDIKPLEDLSFISSKALQELCARIVHECSGKSFSRQDFEMKFKQDVKQIFKLELK